MKRRDFPTSAGLAGATFSVPTDGLMANISGSCPAADDRWLILNAWNQPAIRRVGGDLTFPFLPVFHAGSSGWITPSAAGADCFEFVAQVWRSSEVTRALGAPCESHDQVLLSDYADARGFPLTPAAQKNLAGLLLERAGINPSKNARWPAILTCVLDDPSAGEAAIAMSEVARASGFDVVAIVSDGHSGNEATASNLPFFSALQQRVTAVHRVKLDDVQRLVGPPPHDECDEANQCDYLGSVVALIADLCSGRCLAGIDWPDVSAVLKLGGRTALLQHSLPADGSASDAVDDFLRRTLASMPEVFDARGALVLLDGGGNGLVPLFGKILDGFDSLAMGRVASSFIRGPETRYRELRVLAVGLSERSGAMTRTRAGHTNDVVNRRQ